MWGTCFNRSSETIEPFSSDELLQSLVTFTILLDLGES